MYYIITIFKSKTNIKTSSSGLGYGSVAEPLHTTHETLGGLPRAANTHANSVSCQQQYFIKVFSIQKEWEGEERVMRVNIITTHHLLSNK